MTPSRFLELREKPSLAVPLQLTGADLFSGLISVTVPSPD
jgi:hypothetical protein